MEDKLYTKDEFLEILRDFANKVDDEYRQYTKNNILGFQLLDNYIFPSECSNETEEIYIKFSFGHLSRVIEWNILCDIISVDYYKMSLVDDDEIFDIKESVAIEYGLIKSSY